MLCRSDRRGAGNSCSGSGSSSDMFISIVAITLMAWLVALRLNTAIYLFSIRMRARHGPVWTAAWTRENSVCRMTSRSSPCGSNTQSVPRDKIQMPPSAQRLPPLAHTLDRHAAYCRARMRIEEETDKVNGMLCSPVTCRGELKELASAAASVSSCTRVPVHFVCLMLWVHHL